MSLIDIVIQRVNGELHFNNQPLYFSTLLCIHIKKKQRAFISSFSHRSNSFVFYLLHTKRMIFSTDITFKRVNVQLTFEVLWIYRDDTPKIYDLLLKSKFSKKSKWTHLANQFTVTLKNQNKVIWQKCKKTSKYM